MLAVTIGEPRPRKRRRACLAVPGSSERMLVKAARSGADELVIDLEDAVAPAEKDKARKGLLPLLEQLDTQGSAVAVRVNQPRSEWCHRDIAELAEASSSLTSIVVPKVESAGDLAFIDRLLDGAEAAARRERPLRVQALIETAAGLARAEEIAGSSMRLDSLILGYADLAASLGRSTVAGEDASSWSGAQERLLLAARAHDLQAIDGPYFSLDDEEGLSGFAARVAAAGFDGKWAIHPRQIETITDAFTPTVVEVDQAEAVLAALAGAEKDGVGAVALDGKMVDEAMATAARRLLQRAGRLA
ncbi:MAG: HpcH/HpaI aldolase/citrate lyase family protein [Solirubrobacterales bacterium]